MRVVKGEKAEGNPFLWKAHVVDERKRLMVTQEASAIREQWHRWITPPERQRDRRWLEQYRNLVTYDAEWWWTAAGPFTDQERRQWEQTSAAPANEAARDSLTALMTCSRHREVQAAWAEQRPPRLHYPAIPLDDVRVRLVKLSHLRETIFRHEPDELVSYLYAGAIDEGMQNLRLLEAAGEGDAAAFREGQHRRYRAPSDVEMCFALFRLRCLIQQGLDQEETRPLSQWLHHFVEYRLCLILDLSEGKDDLPVAYEQERLVQTISAQALCRFLATILHDYGYDGWQVIVATGGQGVRVETSAHQIILSPQRLSLPSARRLLAREVAVRVARTFAGDHAPLRLLGSGTQGYAVTEAGLSWYLEREALTCMGLPCPDVALWAGTLAAGLASGEVAPPQRFWSLFDLLEHLFLLDRRLSLPWEGKQTAQRMARREALEHCLRTYRGVPDLGQVAVCSFQEGASLRGWQRIERAATADTTVLDRLMGGTIAYELLPVLHTVLPASPPQPLRKLAADPALDRYLLSFERAEKEKATLLPSKADSLNQ